MVKGPIAVCVPGKDIFQLSQLLNALLSAFFRAETRFETTEAAGDLTPFDGATRVDEVVETLQLTAGQVKV